MSPSPLGAFYRSPLGSFYRSPLGAFGGPAAPDLYAYNVGPLKFVSLSATLQLYGTPGLPDVLVESQSANATIFKEGMASIFTMFNGDTAKGGNGFFTPQVALISPNDFTGIAASDTAASHPGWRHMNVADQGPHGDNYPIQRNINGGALPQFFVRAPWSTRNMSAATLVTTGNTLTFTIPLYNYLNTWTGPRNGPRGLALYATPGSVTHNYLLAALAFPAAFGTSSNDVHYTKVGWTLVLEIL